jgi:hypothetical protein
MLESIPKLYCFFLKGAEHGHTHGHVNMSSWLMYQSLAYILEVSKQIPTLAVDYHSSFTIDYFNSLFINSHLQKKLFLAALRLLIGRWKPSTFYHWLGSKSRVQNIDILAGRDTWQWWTLNSSLPDSRVQLVHKLYLKSPFSTKGR